VAGRCSAHNRELRESDPEKYARILALSGEDAEHEFYLTKYNLPHPKWQFEGDEEYLAMLCESRQIEVCDAKILRKLSRA
jgi:hypothetical protein